MKRFFVVSNLVMTLSCCSNETPQTNDNSSSQPFSVKCAQKLPEFTLGYQSNPTKSQIDELCSCVWNKLDGWEKDASIAIAEGREKDVSFAHMKGFPSRFGGYINDCGGQDL